MFRDYALATETIGRESAAAGIDDPDGTLVGIYRNTLSALASERAARERLQERLDQFESYAITVASALDERAARERAEAAHAGCDAQVRTLVTKALAAVRGQEKAEAERDEAREALADAGTLMGKTIAMSYCTSAEMPERDHTHALPSAMLRVIRERDAAESRLAAAEKDRDREIEARRAAERATENHAALRAENARLNEALANWHDNEARWIGNSERYPDADLREARSVLRDLAASASIRRAALAPAAPAKEPR